MFSVTNHKGSILLAYTDDTILLGPDQTELQYLIKKISNKIQEKGNL